MLITADQLKPILNLYHEGQMLRAYAAAQTLGPLKEWRGAAARVVAGRLAMNLGAPRRARLLHWLAHRDEPKDPEALYYWALGVFERRGPLPTWELLRRHGELPGAPPRIRADWLSLHARTLSWFRDFQSAHTWQARAEELAPKRAWLLVERSELLQREDRYNEALDAARRSLELHPWYRPGVQCTADLLQLLDRDQEALALLKEAAEKLESGPAMMHLAALETELGLHEHARRDWDRVVALSPMLEKEFEKWLSARRSDAAYYCGDYTAAAELAEKADNPFHKDVAPRLLENKGEGKRTLLKVGFVRQHHMTCAPATLSALSRFWSKPAEHLEIVEAICYDGTPAHSERSWAEQNGYVAREFTVTWDSATALLDRGVPFTFTTVETASAHLQAVIGYDAPRGTLLIRAPYMRYFAEFIGTPTFERYKSTGPRGMVFVPRDRADELLAGIDLPEAELYDVFYDVQKALVAHDRIAARAGVERMNELSPNHRITLWARRAIASYDANITDSLAAVDGLLALYPTDANLRLWKLSYLRALARRDERLTLLSEASAEKESDPIFWQEYAQELKEDAREQAHAERWLRRALRYRRLDARTLCSLADIRWEQRRLPEAVELYRFAACLQETDQGMARTYFVASRHIKKTADAIQLLRDRFKRFGKKSGFAARSLFWALEELNRNEEGFAALEEALTLRPQDGDLLLYAASAHARHGRFEKADELLAAAKGKTPHMIWARGAAEIALIRGLAAEALLLWREISDAEPFALDAHRMIAQLLAETQSPAAALAHVQQAVDRFPHNYRLNQLWVEWAKSEEGPVAVEAAIRRLIAIHAADGWSRRELVWALLAQGRDTEALEEAQIALNLEPSNPSSPFYVGLVLMEQGKVAEARDAYRQAISLSVDADFAISHLVNACDTIAQKKEALAFVKEELIKQTIFGDGLLAYRSHARDVLQPKELLTLLREALEARPDLWHGWSAVSAQLSEMGEHVAAEKVATDASQRFALLPRIWLDLANVYRALNQPKAEIAALRTALEISPGWGQPVRQLAEVYERLGEFDKGRELLEQAIKRSPLDAYNHGSLADTLWKQNNRDAALERVQQAVKLEPGYSWAWDALGHYAAELNRPELAEQLARELTERRAGEARSWLVLARTLRSPDQLDERLTALDKTIELNPRNLDAYDLRARLLTEAGRFDEALAACRPALWGDNPPSRLIGRAAWVLGERGDLKAAIDQMRKVVEDDPNYYWAWACLADWYRRTEDKDNYLKTAEFLHRQWPLEAVPLGYLGEARLWKEDRPGAREALREAVARFPDYEFAAGTLLAMELKDGNRADAEAVLATLRTHCPGLMTMSREVRFAARLDNATRAAEALAHLARQETTERQAIDQAVDAMTEARMSQQTIRVLSEVLPMEKTSPMIGGLLVEQLCNNGRFDEAREVAEKCVPRGDIGREAAQSLLFHCAKHLNEKELTQFLVACGSEVHKDTHLWGWGGYALQTVRDYRTCVDWMGDWRSRKEAQSWMLVNFAEALRALGRDDEAREIHQHATKLEAHAEPRSIHHLWLAGDAALDGVNSDVTVLLKQVDTSALRPQHQFLRGLVDALLAAREGRSHKVVCNVLKKARATYPNYTKDIELSRMQRRVLKKLLRTHGGLLGRAWYLTQLAGG